MLGSDHPPTNQDLQLPQCRLVVWQRYSGTERFTMNLERRTLIMTLAARKM